MIGKLFSKILDVNARELERLQKRVDEINSFDKKVSKLKKADFAVKTEEFKKRLSKGEKIENFFTFAQAFFKFFSFYRKISLLKLAYLFEKRIYLINPFLEPLQLPSIEIGRAHV